MLRPLGTKGVTRGFLLLEFKNRREII